MSDTTVDQGESRGPTISEKLSMPVRQDRGQAQSGEQTRLTREQETHLNDPIHGFEDIDFSARPDNLAAPPARPGMDQRWIARKVMGDAATAMPTFSKQMEQGWKARPADTIKGFDSLRVDDVNLGLGILERNGLVLCERDARISKMFRKSVRELTDQQTEGVNSALRQTEQQGGIPIRTVNKTRTVRGRRAVEAAPDYDDDGL